LILNIFPDCLFTGIADGFDEIALYPKLTTPEVSFLNLWI
jgi:hypothetical protein